MKAYKRSKWNTWPMALLVGAMVVAFGPEPWGLLKDRDWSMDRQEETERGLVNSLSFWSWWESLPVETKDLACLVNDQATSEGISLLMEAAAREGLDMTRGEAGAFWNEACYHTQR